jgi:hypothetical protein
MQNVIFDLTRGLVLLSLSVSAFEFYKLKNEILLCFSSNKKLLFKCFLVLLPVGIVLSLFNPHFLVMVLAALILATYLFDGSFNGGSDYMNFLIVLSLIVYSFSTSENIQIICLMYIGVQSLLSYFLAGLSKVVKPDWRNGQNLRKIVVSSSYLIPDKFRILLERTPGLTLLLSWLIIISELFIIVGFFNFKIASVLVLFFLLFHLVNIYIFGLNRFFFAWLASYPCLLFCFYR